MRAGEKAPPAVAGGGKEMKRSHSTDEAAAAYCNNKTAPGPEHPRPSLFRSTATVPCVVRFGLPLLFLGNSALLLYSNFTLGAAVHARIFDGHGETFELPVLYKVSLGGAIHDMWKGGAYVMASLIAVASGAWPHVKVLVSLLAWFSDERMLSARARARLLVLTYVLQKFSHVETATLVILMTAFSFTAKLPNHEDWGCWTYVHPAPGFYCFLGGLILSMALSRVALHYDHVSRKAVAALEKAAAARNNAQEEGGGDEEGSARSEPCLSVASASSSAAASPARTRRKAHDQVALLQEPTAVEPSVWRDVLTAYFLLALLLGFVLGLVLPVFSFQFEGLAGWVLDHVTEGSPDSSTSLRTASVISLGQGIPGSSDTPNGLGIRFLQASFFFFVVGAPVGCLALLLGLLLLPIKYSRRLVTATEVLYAWAAPDVLFVSMVACTAEMHLFVRFVIGDRCDTINAVLRVLMDRELDGDDKCFDVVTSLKPGCWVLGCAAVLFFAAGFVVIRKVARQAEAFEAMGEEDEDEEDDGDAEERPWRQPQQRPALPLPLSSPTRAAVLQVPLLHDEELGATGAGGAAEDPPRRWWSWGVWSRRHAPPEGSQTAQ